jgi:putative transposase
MVKDREGLCTVCDLQYHFVWVTKWRHEVLRGEVGDRTRELIRQGCVSLGITLMKGHVGRDHLQLLVSAPPSLAPGRIARYLKGRSSQVPQQEFSHLQGRYCGRGLWARGYFCGTTGQVTTDQIERYVEGHCAADAGEFTIDGD